MHDHGLGREEQAHDVRDYGALRPPLATDSGCRRSMGAPLRATMDG